MTAPEQGGAAKRSRAGMDGSEEPWEGELSKDCLVEECQGQVEGEIEAKEEVFLFGGDTILGGVLARRRLFVTSRPLRLEIFRTRHVVAFLFLSKIWGEEVLGDGSVAAVSGGAFFMVFLAALIIVLW